MYYKEYPGLGIKVSAVGYGTMRYNQEDLDANNLQKCADVVLYAAEKGINYFDTAPTYCDDKSEDVTGLALSQLKRDSYYVSSKTHLNLLDNDYSHENFRRRLELSLKRLKVDYLDFYHVWCILNPDSYQEHMEKLYPEMVKARDEGLIKNIVFSSHMQGKELENEVSDGKYKGVLVGYNALNYKFRQEGIEAAYKNNMGVVVMNPLGGGLIPQNPEVFKYLMGPDDENVAQAALRFVASQKEVTITLAGMTDFSHVDDAVKAVENLKERSAAEVSASLAGGMDINNLCTGCGYCNKCPLGIPVPKFMDAYNQKILKGGNVDVIMKYHWGISPEQAATCIECGQCEGLCTQHLPIIDRLKELSEVKL